MKLNEVSWSIDRRSVRRMRVIDQIRRLLSEELSNGIRGIFEEAFHDPQHLINLDQTRMPVIHSKIMFIGTEHRTPILSVIDFTTQTKSDVEYLTFALFQEIKQNHVEIINPLGVLVETQGRGPLSLDHITATPVETSFRIGYDKELSYYI